MNYKFYEEQVKLLLKVLPIVASEKVFALKGGTAINFFFRDLPRLSVDIDLTYIPVEDRNISIININIALTNISEKIKKTGLKVFERGNNSGLKKLDISDNKVSIKIEPNYLLRGSVYEPERLKVSQTVSDKFGMSSYMNVLNFNELYGGKICAALDRQHPRDLFDIKLLVENEGFTRDIIKTFLVYLISHNRPINEMLNPNFSQIETVFKNEFQGMTVIPVRLDELIEVRELMVKSIINSLTDKDKQFLLSFKKGTPDWKLFEFQNAKNLPAVLWKLKNIHEMKPNKHKEQLNKLVVILENV